jgi:hypothetical protein
LTLLEVKSSKMSQEKKASNHSGTVSSAFSTDGQPYYEPAFRRWLIRELDAGRMTNAEAIHRFNLHPKQGHSLIWYWRKRYGSSLEVTLPVMTEKERLKLEALQRQVQALEKQLEKAQMQNIALETLIDVAEEKLKIDIRKKPGPKQ